MRKLLVLLFVVLSATLASAQGSIDAEKVYLWTGGTQRVAISTGSGSPSGGVTGNTYIDYASGELWTKRAGTWTVIPRLEAAQTWTGATTWTSDLTLNQAAPQIYLRESDQGTDLKLWTVNVNNQVFSIQTLNDAASSVLVNAVTIARNGAVAHAGTLDQTGTATVHADVLPFAGYTSNLGTLSKKYLTLYASELWVETLVAQNTIATIGGRMLVAPTTPLQADRGAQLVPGAPTVTPQGTPGATTYSYKISALDLDGESTPSSAGQTTTGNATLSVSNFNRLTWSTVTGATQYAVYGRTSGSWLLIAVTSSTTYDDTGAITPSGAVQSTNGTARTFHVKHNQMTVGDQPYMESNGKVEFLQVAQWAISVVNQGAKTFKIGGDRTNLFVNGSVFKIEGSTGNNQLFTVTGASTYNIVSNLTTITVVESIPSAVADGGITWLAAAVGVDFAYFMTRDRDGTGSNDWYSGDAMLNTGTTGKGFIDLYSTSGVLSGSGPSIVGNVRTSTTYNAIAPRWAIGNLNGTYGYVAETYGVAMGDASATNVTIDATNGLRIRSGTTDKLKADTSGNLALTGDFSMGTAGAFRSGATAFGTGTGWWLDYNSGTPRFRVGNPSGNYLSWDGTDLTIVSANLTANASGVVVADDPASFSTSHGYALTSATIAGSEYGVFGYTSSPARRVNLLNHTTATTTTAQTVVSSQSDTRSAGILFYASGSASGCVAPCSQVGISATDDITLTSSSLSLLPSNGVQVGTPTGGGKGAGTINVSADIYKNNTAYTNPDYVFEHWATGRVTKYATNPGAARYVGLMPLDDLRNYVQTNYRFPQISEGGTGLFQRGDIALELIEQAHLYIFELETRIHALEQAVKGGGR